MKTIKVNALRMRPHLRSVRLFSKAGRGSEAEVVRVFGAGAKIPAPGKKFPAHSLLGAK
jgi:hypothetical protein